MAIDPTYFLPSGHVNYSIVGQEILSDYVGKDLSMSIMCMVNPKFRPQLIQVGSRSGWVDT